MLLRDYTAADLEGMDKDQARRVHQHHMEEVAKENGGDITAASTKVKTLMPRLHGACKFDSGEEEKQPTPIPNSSALPADWQSVMRSMGMPYSITQTEARIVWLANGSRGNPFPLRGKDIFDMLVGYYISSQNLADTGARQAVAEKFPSLAGFDSVVSPERAKPSNPFVPRR